MIGFGIIWPLVPVFAVQLGAKGLQIGLIIAAFNIARSISNPFIGRLCDHTSHKGLIFSGLLISSLISVGYITATSTTQLVLIRMLHGFASALVVPVAMALAAIMAPATHLGKFLGTLNMALLVGMGIGPMLGGFIKDEYGMDYAFVVMSLIALLTSIGVLIGIPKELSSEAASNGNTSVSINQFLKHRQFKGLFLLRLFASMGQGAVYTFLPVLAFKTNLSSAQIGVILGVNIFTIAGLQRSLGSYADRTNPVSAMVLATGLSGLTVAAMPLFPSFYIILVLNIMMAMANALALATGWLVAGRMGYTLGMGSVMGALDSARSIGFIVSPVISGFIYDHFGILPVFFFGGSLVIMASLYSYKLLSQHPLHSIYKQME